MRPLLPLAIIAALVGCYVGPPADDDAAAGGAAPGTYTVDKHTNELGCQDVDGCDAYLLAPCRPGDEALEGWCSKGALGELGCSNNPAVACDGFTVFRCDYTLAAGEAYVLEAYVTCSADGL